MTDQQQDLKNCPCCGSNDVGGAVNIVHCYKCGLNISKDRPLQNAVDAWNTRAPPPSSELRERLSKEIKSIEYGIARGFTSGIIREKELSIFKECLAALSSPPGVTISSTQFEQWARLTAAIEKENTSPHANELAQVLTNTFSTHAELALSTNKGKQ